MVYSSSMKDKNEPAFNPLFTAAFYKDAPPCRPDIWTEKSGSKWVDRNITDINCYAYACNDLYRHPEHEFCAPGAKSYNEHVEDTLSYGEYIKAFKGNTNDLIKACESDGMIFAGTDIPVPKDKHYLTAAFVNANKQGSYHWFRLDTNGLWSHKPSSIHDVTNKDNEGNLIIDPRQAAALTSYDQFVGFFFVPAGGLKTGAWPEPNPHQEKGSQKSLEQYERHTLSQFTKEELSYAPHFKADLWADYGNDHSYVSYPWDSKWLTAIDSYSYASGDIYKHDGCGAAYPGQKGLKGQFNKRALSEQKIICGAENDGMTFVGKTLQVPPAGYYLTACALDNQKNGLWFRLDQNGLWSWKTAGNENARQEDFNGRPITDPATADRREYNNFIGFFLVPVGGIKVGYGPENGRQCPYKR